MWFRLQSSTQLHCGLRQPGSVLSNRPPRGTSKGSLSLSGAIELNIVVAPVWPLGHWRDFLVASRAALFEEGVEEHEVLSVKYARRVGILLRLPKCDFGRRLEYAAPAAFQCGLWAISRSQAARGASRQKSGLKIAESGIVGRYRQN